MDLFVVYCNMSIGGLAVMCGNLLSGWVMQQHGARILSYAASGCVLVATFPLSFAFHEEHGEA